MHAKLPTRVRVVPFGRFDLRYSGCKLVWILRVKYQTVHMIRPPRRTPLPFEVELSEKRSVESLAMPARVSALCQAEAMNIQALALNEPMRSRWKRRLFP